MKRTRKLLVMALAIAMLGLVPQVAFAQGVPDRDHPTVEEVEHPHSIGEAKKRAAAAIAKRLVALGRIDARVKTSSHITGAPEDRLIGDYATARAGLSALGRQIQDAETQEELRSSSH